MSPDQRQVLSGMASGAAAGFVVLTLGWALGPTLSARLGHDRIAALGLVLLALPLAWRVGRVAACRFFGAGIDGGDASGDPELDLGRRILTNTLEQAVLAALAFAALVVALPERLVGGALVYALGFVAARLAFEAGYRRAGVARAFGFAATFYTTLLALAVAASFAITG